MWFSSLIMSVLFSNFHPGPASQRHRTAIEVEKGQIECARLHSILENITVEKWAAAKRDSKAEIHASDSKNDGH